MAENTINDFNTLPEQVQINKEDIKTNTTNIATNTADITKLKDDIGKIKPNAWEEKKFNVDIGITHPIEFTTYNPITNQYNPIVNIQRAFTDKDTYTLTDAINSYSFAVSGLDLFAYVVCADPSLSLNDLIVDRLENTTKNAMMFANTDVGGHGEYWLLINCRWIKTETLTFRGDTINYIDKISTDDDKSENSILTAKAVDQYYLKKSDASNTYVTKVHADATYVTKVHADATYVTKQDYEESIDKGDIQFTTQGWTKFKNIIDTEGQTITLNVPGDLLEHVQTTGINDLKLQLNYNGHAVFENIYLHPNNSINNLDYIAGAKSTYYTGQAVLTLSTQSEALFYIVYQEATGITLQLITTI